jgi:predicted nucleic acid-binding protein
LIVVFDATMLVLLLDHEANAPIDESTGHPVADCKARVEYMISELQRNGSKIVIPSPALAEVMVWAPEAAADWLKIISGSKHFKIAPFDTLAAVEHAARERARLLGKRDREVTKAKMKFDQQIVAIAAVEQASIIFSDDAHIVKLVDEGVQVIGIAQLPLPPEDAQRPLI